MSDTTDTLKPEQPSVYAVKGEFCENLWKWFLETYTASAKKELEEMPEGDLILCHHSLGRAIRNKFLYQRSSKTDVDARLSELAKGLPNKGVDLKDRKLRHPDGLSGLAVNYLWCRSRGCL